MHSLETIIQINKEASEKQDKLALAVKTLQTLFDTPNALGSLGAWALVANTLEELKS
jgi:hypothetical protein